LEVIKFTYGPFSENTYVLTYGNEGECAVIDPGMYDSEERNHFLKKVEEHRLKPRVLLNTHCHIDHVLGNKFIFDNYGLTPKIHPLAEQMLKAAELSAKMYGLNYDPSPEGETSLSENEGLTLGSHQLKVLFTPGHSPGHVVFYNEKEGFVIGGDVLFRDSVGRVDLPMSNAEDLRKSIQDKMYLLPDEVVVYPGHGPETTIGYEKVNNQFVRSENSNLS